MHTTMRTPSADASGAGVQGEEARAAKASELFAAVAKTLRQRRIAVELLEHTQRNIQWHDEQLDRAQQQLAELGLDLTPRRGPICPYADAIGLIAAEIDRILGLPLPPERRDQFTEVFERAYKPLVLPVLKDCHARPASPGAGACVAQAPQLTERLVVLLAALRAYRGEGDFVFVSGHAAEGTALAPRAPSSSADVGGQPDALELGAGGSPGRCT